MLATLKKKFKAQMDSLSTLAYALVGVAIVGGTGVLVTAQFNSSTTNTNAHTFLADVMTSYETLGDFLPVVVIALVGLLLISYFRGR